MARRSASASLPRPRPLEEGTESLILPQALRAEGTLALGNPKMILIFAAFFPQFVNVERSAESRARPS